ncbi:hypothetical protein BDZ94DRAFT_1254477 [Collybia nuda]|uniref:Uncharacterized protein n=1 Tax=Collybia nuda TaxID=64659 RepID=A0A9P6CGC9_9AGAR|nr:hypothetical protein BDZ94DRAFT_1254477 [Collybia nuda]
MYSNTGTMDGIGCIDPPLLQLATPSRVAQTAGITLFEPGVDGLLDEGGEIDINGYYAPTEGGREGGQDVGTDCGRGPEIIPVYPNQVARVTAQWVNHNAPLLHDYAVRQIRPPLSNRVNVEFNHPSQFVTGMMQMLANRDPKGEDDPEPTRRTPPQLLEGFVDLNRWAKEYLRAHYGLERLGEGVPNLLTIIANNFYEAHMHLMDAIMEKAISNMGTRRGPFLEAGDFNFGFDLRMSQEMPFLVSSRHRVRETIDHLQSASKSSTALPGDGFSRYGRRSKPTAGAQLAAGSREDPARVQPKQIMPKVPRPPKNKKATVPASPSEVEDAGTPPVPDATMKKGRVRKPAANPKALFNSEDPSVAIPNKARQPLGETSLINAAPPQGAGGGKSQTHLALIKRHASVPAFTSRTDARSFDQRLPKIIIKPLVHFTSQVSTPRDSAPGDGSIVDVTSKGTTTVVDLASDTSEVVANANMVAPQGSLAGNSITQPSDPLLVSTIASSEISQYKKTAVSLKRKRENSVENRLS